MGSCRDRLFIQRTPVTNANWVDLTAIKNTNLKKESGFKFIFPSQHLTAHENHKNIPPAHHFGWPSAHQYLNLLHVHTPILYKHDLIGNHYEWSKKGVFALKDTIENEDVHEL